MKFSCLITLALLAAGCASSPNNLTMTSQDQRHGYKQVFSHAYSALNDDGDYDVVLIHDANSDALADSSGALTPAAVTPRQVVHIRVFWIPERNTKLDHPVATNASIRWFVFGERSDEAANLLEYSGSGLVLVNDDGRISHVTIRGAYLKAVERRGQMADPLGPSTVSGAITAQVDRRRVQDALDEVKATEQAASEQADAR
jgi:hypothetical protein